MSEKSYFRLQLDSTIQEIERLLKAVCVVAKKELVRQTVIAIEQMKKNGDCIAEGELGDAVTVSV